MAAFRHYANGRWATIVRRKGSHPQCKVFATHSDAKRWANQIESAIDRGVFVDRTECERTTVADLIDRYLWEVTPKKNLRDPKSRG